LKRGRISTGARLLARTARGTVAAERINHQSRGRRRITA
jgi:hypothetical protein